MNLILNGQPRTFALADDATLDHLIQALELQGDRVAVEHNGEIVPRTQWTSTSIKESDRFEIVHFVGGGYC